MIKHIALLITAMLFALCIGSGASAATDTRTTPPDSLGGLRPGTLTVDQLTTQYGKPEVVERGGLLELYGGAADSEVYGWFMVENPDYDIPDIVAETAPGSNRVDLVMAIGYDGVKTEKGVACYQSEAELIKAYGNPDFVFAAPMNGFVLREFYYITLGVSFDVAPVNSMGDREVVAIYVTYPEFLQRAVQIRKDYIGRGIGRDITKDYRGTIDT